MRLLRLVLLGLAAAAPAVAAEDEFFDRLAERLAVSSADEAWRARLSGTLDAEGYAFSGTAPGLIYTPGRSLFNPRLTLFVDAQFGPHVYGFVQARADRGFDPTDGGPRLRPDEYALRFTPAESGIFSFQIGRFATIVGNWAPRHGSWENPFVTAPLPYEHVTGVWDSFAARTLNILLAWSHLRPLPFTANEYPDKHLRLPVLWGPAYATGAAVFGRVGSFIYAAEVKNAPVSSRPHTWDEDGAQWSLPSFGGRIAYAPNPTWNFGVSATTGPYLVPTAAPTVAPGFTRADYRQTVIAQDAAFAWHHLQVWAEIFASRFTIPRVGDADTVAYYTEVKYKFSPQFSGAVRWNQQLFSSLTDTNGVGQRWGRNVWRFDVAPAYRVTAHLQLKLQLGLQREERAVTEYSRLAALQATVRF